MAELQDYALNSIFVDGTYLVQLVGMTLRTESGDQPVNLMNEGLGGFSPGPGVVTVNIRYAIPAAGVEFNFNKAVFEKGYHTVQVNSGAEAYIGSGKFMNDERTGSTGSPTEGTVDFTGEFAPLE